MPKDDSTANVDLDLDKFFDSLEGDDNDVDDELAKALADQDDKDTDDTKGKLDEDPTDDDDDGDGSKTSTDDMSLEERLALLEKENKGLKKDIVKVRTDRRSYKEDVQEARDRYNRLHGMIEQMTKGGPQSTDTGAKTEDPFKDLKLSVEYDDDGNPYVPADALAELIKGQEKKLEDTKNEYLKDKQLEQERSQVQKTIDSIVSKDEQYPGAYRTVEKALADMNQRVIDIQKDKGLRGVLTPGQAIDLLEQEGALEEWQETFPGLDPDIISNAFQSKRQLNKALEFVKSTMKPGDEKITDDNKARKSLQQAAIQDKLAKKPASHGKGSVEAKDSIIEKVGSSSSMEILNLGDKDVERLMARMRQEELESYK